MVESISLAEMPRFDLWHLSEVILEDRISQRSPDHVHLHLLFRDDIIMWMTYIDLW